MAKVASPVINTQTDKKSSSALPQWIFDLWIWLPALPYFYLVNIYAVNFPYQDDYNAILEFLTKFDQANFGDKLGLLFSQHNDHRIFHSRVVYVLQHALMGKINFRGLIFLGNLQLLAIFGLLVSFIKRALPNSWRVVSCIVALVIFDPSSYENADFAMSGLQNYGVIMLFLLTLFYFGKKGNLNLIVALLFQIICIYSSGNGLVAQFFVLAYLVLSSEKRKAIIAGISYVIFTPLYFINYVKAVPAGAVKSEFSLLTVGKFFIHMTGSHFGFEQSIAAGFILLGLLVWFFPLVPKFKLKENTTVLICILGFVFASMGITSLFRSSTEMGELGSYQSRYLIYAHLLCTITLVFMAIKLEGKKIFWPALGVALVVFGVAYKSNYQYGEACLNMTKSRLEYYPYYYGGHKEKDNEIARQIETEACKLGIYCISDER